MDEQQPLGVSGSTLQGGSESYYSIMLTRMDSRRNILRLRMLSIPKRYSHFLFGLIQSGFTCAIAAAIASAPFMYHGIFISHWLKSWIIAWATMIPFVLLATPLIRRTVDVLSLVVKAGVTGQRQCPPAQADDPFIVDLLNYHAHLGRLAPGCSRSAAMQCSATSLAPRMRVAFCWTPSIRGPDAAPSPNGRPATRRAKAQRAVS